MGTSDATLKIRVDPEMLARWRAAAEHAAVSVSELVRDSVERQIVPPTSRSMPVAEDGFAPRTPAARQREGEDRGPAISRGPVGVTVRTTSDPKHPVAKAGAVRCPKSSLHERGRFCRYCGQTP